MKARRSGPARAATLAAVLASMVSLAVQLSLAPSTLAAGPLPACRYDDILTSPRQYTDWPVTLVDTILRVPSSYVPPDLVSVSQAGIVGGGRVRVVMIEDLQAMAEAAAAADAKIGVVSAYRSYQNQQAVFKDWVARLGYNRALKVSARPGHSEHQLGLAVDFDSDPPSSSTLAVEWATTKAGKWMNAHAWEYGFVMSYPKGKIGVACYDYEPWHYRYVGRDNAAAIHQSGVTPREWLWANFTTTVVPGKTARPGQSAPPIETPVATPPASAPASPTPAPPSPSPAATSSPGPATLGPPSQPAPPAATQAPVGAPVWANLDGASLAGLALALGAALIVLFGLGAKVLRRRGPHVGL